MENSDDLTNRFRGSYTEFSTLETGDVSKVAPIDKLSVAIAIGLSIVILKEPLEPKTIFGAYCRRYYRNYLVVRAPYEFSSNLHDQDWQAIEN